MRNRRFILLAILSAVLALIFLLREPLRLTLREWTGFEPDRVGRYWDRRVELDLVALDRKRERAIIGEIKWSVRPVGEDVARDLEERAEGAEALGSFKKRYLLISRSGFTPGLARAASDRLLLVDLRALDLRRPTLG
jgi:AAA+ ATPase superfamily predicted ATPase